MIDVEVWVRGRQDATTERIDRYRDDAGTWTDDDVKMLLEGMLLALQRTNDPAGDPPPVTLRGFSWIVSPERGRRAAARRDATGHGKRRPVHIDERRLTDMVSRVIGGPEASTMVH